MNSYFFIFKHEKFEKFEFYNILQKIAYRFRKIRILLNFSLKIIINF